MKKRLVYLVCIISLVGGCTSTSPKYFCQKLPTLLESCGIITDGYGHGSCVVIAPDVVLTAGHCLGHYTSWVEINGKRYEIIEEWSSARYDIGFVKIDGVLPFVAFGEAPKLLETVYIVGAPADPALINNITVGIVSNLDVDWDMWEDLFITQAASWGGNSGGPVFNTQGLLVGILVAGPPGSDSFSMCENIEHILEALEEYNGVG